MKRFTLLIIASLAFYFNSFSQSAIYLKNGVSLTLGSSSTLTVIGDLKTTDSGGTDTALISNAGNIEISGSWLNTGTGGLLNTRPGSVKFNGTSAQLIEGSTYFYFLTIDNTNGVSINSGINYIRHQLDLTAGTFATNDSLTLLSIASKTGRIAPILNGTISGDVIIQSFVESADYDYRFLTIPVQGGTLSDWSDDFLMTGFTGTPFPSFHFVNVYTYDETVLGDKDNGFISASNITDAVGMGQGVQAYIGAADILVDAKGEIYSGTLDLPVTYTDDLTQPGTEDGWNLVANPYPSTIDWDSPDWTRTNINDAIYIYKGSNNVNQSYIAGVGTNGGNRYIASSQAFWIQANNSPLLRITENVKVDVNAGFVERNAPPDVLRIRLTGTGATNQDEIVVRYHQAASSKFDRKWDARKFKASSQQLAITAIQDSVSYSILSTHEDSITLAPSIYLQTEVNTSGQYEISISQLPSNVSCLFLEDLFTGRIESLRDSTIFHFYLHDTTSVPRFKLNATPLIKYELSQALCPEDSAELKVNTAYTGSLLLKWRDDLFAQSYTDSSFSTSSVKLADGRYFFEADHASCYAQQDTFVIQSPDSFVLQMSTSYDSLTGLSDVWVHASGGLPPYQYRWNTNSTHQSDSISGVPNGIYTVVITDANACIDSASITINHVSVGIDDFSNSLGISVFPNPTTNYIQLVNPKAKALHYELYDVNGKLIFSEFTKETLLKMSVLPLPSGVYFLKLITNEQTEVVKLKKI